MDINSIMNMINGMQGSLPDMGEQVKKHLKDIIVNVSVGGGAICIQMDGLFTVTQLDIINELLSQEEKKTLIELIVMAMNQVVKEVKAKQKEKLKQAGIPVDMLGGLF